MLHPFIYLEATDASGCVERQQKIMHAHESPFYHYAQFPHLFAITYRRKKYSRILFGQTTYSASIVWLSQRRLDDWDSSPGRGRILLFVTMSRLHLKPTCSPVQRILGKLFSWVNAPGVES
jgi:hypothetical protein